MSDFSDLKKNDRNRILPSPSYTSAIWAPQVYMTVYIFGSRREFMANDIYNLIFADSRIDSSLYLFNTTVFKNHAWVEGHNNLIKNYLDPVPVITGTLTADYTNGVLTVSGVTMSQAGWVLAVWDLSSQLSSPTVSELKLVSNFQGYYFDFFNSGAVSFSVSGTYNGDYTIYLLAFDRNPRKDHAVSNIVSLTQNFQSTPATTKAYLFFICTFWVWYIFLLLIN